VDFGGTENHRAGVRGCNKNSKKMTFSAEKKQRQTMRKDKEGYVQLFGEEGAPEQGGKTPDKQEAPPFE